MARPSVEELCSAFVAEQQRVLDAAVTRIRHCLGQLTAEQIWWRPHPSMNSIGNLVLHVCGNLGQWIVRGVPQLPDVRNRPAEFAERGPIPAEQLLEQLEQTVDAAHAVLDRLSAGELLAPRQIQGFEESVLGAISQSLHHLSGHVQEIISLTRMQLGDAYRYLWSPRTKEEGKPDPPLD